MTHRKSDNGRRRSLYCTPPILVLLIFTCGAGDRVPGQDREGSPKPAYLNPSLPLERRVDDLVSRMTMEEKASQLVNAASAIPRLHGPAYNWRSEALHGVAFAGKATVFPEPIGLAASWDATLIREMADVIGTEARAKHNEARDLSQVTEVGDRIIRPGEYQVSVGGGQPGTGASTSEARFSIEGERKLPE
jgi:hypothetical protein